jgi:hypothetical protein
MTVAKSFGQWVSTVRVSGLSGFASMKGILLQMRAWKTIFASLLYLANYELVITLNI